MKTKQAIVIYSAVLVTGLYILYHQQYIPYFLKNYMSIVLAALGLILVLRSFVERKNARMTLILIVLNHCFTVLAISYNERFDYSHSLVYLSGVLLSGTIGYLCLQYIREKERNISLHRFYGYAVKYKKVAFVFFLACLGLSGFPITPTFIGEDLIFSHIQENQFVLAAIVAVSLIVDGISLIRIYARVFLGPYIHNTKDIPYRSS